ERPDRHRAKLGVPHRIELQPLRLPEPARGPCPVDNAGAQAAFAQCRARLGNEPGQTDRILSTLAWSGQPSLNWNGANQNWTPGDANFNANLRVTVVDTTQDVGVAGAFAKTLIYYSAGTRQWAMQHTASQTMAKEIFDRIWALDRDDPGVSILESRSDYQRFDDPIFIPPTFTGVMG